MNYANCRADPHGFLPTKYTYDGLDVILDDSSQLGEPNVTYQNGPGIDNKLKQETGGSASYFLQNHLGSTVKLTNNSGSVTETNGYDSFGRPTNSSFSTRYQFTGREYDSFTGLQYSRARFYDPQIGRFISEDPIGFEGGDVNLYGYVKNNPIKFKDPLGLQDPQPIPYPTPSLPQKNRCCEKTGASMGGEIGGNFHLGFFGYGLGYGSEINPLTGQICVYRKGSMRVGLGAFAGGGLKGNVGVGPNQNTTGSSVEFSEGSLDIGKGLSGRFRFRGFNIPAIGLSSGGSDVGVGIGPGIGAAVGVDWGYKTYIWCSSDSCKN